MIKILKYTLVILLLPFMAMAQNATIKGFVYDKKTGDGMPSANVFLKGTKYSISTDVNGYYQLSGIAPGSYTVQVTFLGYDTIRFTITFKANDIINKKFLLVESATMLDEVDISAKQQEKTTEVNVSYIPVTVEDIKKIPSVGGEPDFAQYVQVLPGVVFTGDQGGQLYIRGGTPIQNKVLLDGMVIYNPFHSIGLFSVFDADIIRNADVYTGGFGAEYGGRISSIMDITTRDGNKKRIGGKVSASTFGAKTLLEGPIKKFNEETGSSASYLISAKTSYLDRSAEYIYPYVLEGLPYSFVDLYGKTSFNSSNGSKLSLFGFNFNDNVNYKGTSSLDWKSYGMGSKFVLVPNNSTVLVDGTFSYSNYNIQLIEADSSPRTSEIAGFNMGLNFTYFKGNNDLRYGIEILGFRTDFEFYNFVKRKIVQQQNTTELAGYLKSKLISKNKKMIFEPSFRLHYYASLRNFSPEPRLGWKYNAFKKLRFKFAGGFYSQNLLSASSDRDVVNLFYGFLSGPENLQKEFTDERGNVKPVKSRLQKAWHAIAGFEYDLGKHWDLNVETYVKRFTQLANINRNKLFDDDEDHADVPDAIKKDFIIETGTARGIDFLLKYDYKHLYIWAVYSLSWVDRWDGINKYMPHFDRRHNVNLVAAYTFGKNLDWEFDCRWNLGSGFPFTKTAGFYENLVFTDGINTDYTNTNFDPNNPSGSNSQLGILYGELNAGRLPYYHRLDLTVKKTFATGENSKLELALGVTNVYNRKNIFYFDRVRYTRVNQLPIMPSVNLTWNF
jgi:hypothetical protein